MRRYLIGRWRDGIIAVDVVKETEKTIWYREVESGRRGCGIVPRTTRERKRTWKVFYATWAEAFVTLKARARERVRSLADDLKSTREDEKKIRAMKEPKR